MKENGAAPRDERAGCLRALPSRQWYVHRRRLAREAACLGVEQEACRRDSSRFRADSQGTRVSGTVQGVSRGQGRTLRGRAASATDVQPARRRLALACSVATDTRTDRPATGGRAIDVSRECVHADTGAVAARSVRTLMSVRLHGTSVLVLRVSRSAGVASVHARLTGRVAGYLSATTPAAPRALVGTSVTTLLTGRRRPLACNSSSCSASASIEDKEVSVGTLKGARLASREAIGACVRAIGASSDVLGTSREPHVVIERAHLVIKRRTGVCLCSPLAIGRRTLGFPCARLVIERRTRVFPCARPVIERRTRVCPRSPLV